MTVHAEFNESLQRILGDDNHALAFATHFQPIVDVKHARIIGYEALTRGPSGSAMHSPLVLFEVALQSGLLVALERVLVRLIARRFVEARLPGFLFVKVSLHTLIASEGRLELIADEFREINLAPSRVVVEIKDLQPHEEQGAIKQVIQGLRALGVIVAFDDVMESFSGINRWIELRPDYIKIDRHFIDGLGLDSVKLEFVRSIFNLASSVGSTVIAEGLENESDLRALQNMGISSCQGYLLARPSQSPRVTLGLDTDSLLNPQQTGSSAARDDFEGEFATNARQLSRRVQIVSPERTCTEIVSMFRTDPDLFSLPVIDASNRPVGLLRRMGVLSRAADRYFIDLFGRRGCNFIMDREPLCFDVSTQLRTMAEAVVGMREEYIIDGFIVTEKGLYFGCGRVTDLLKAVSDAQLLSARYANPLTLLPGNVPLDRHIHSLLVKQIPFYIAYFDLNYFKPFNDVYGYKCGDDVIELCAHVIAKFMDDERDFLGHIGGDDFVGIFESENCEPVIQAILDNFDERVAGFFTEEHRAAGGYKTVDRNGQEKFQPLTSLAVGIVWAGPGMYENPAELAGAATNAKKMAKRLEGSGYFIERRQNKRMLVKGDLNSDPE